MRKETVTKPEIKLVGISVRTSYENELEKMNGKIFPCIVRYFNGGLAGKIPQSKNPGTTFCVYTDYESDYKGAYTYFIGEEVNSIESPLPEGFESLIIPSQTYAKFTTLPAPMPAVIVDAWQHVWGMSNEDLGGVRSYRTDFEIYDERAADHQNIVLDLLVGITPT